MSKGYYNCRRLSRVIRKDVLFLLLGPPAVVTAFEELERRVAEDPNVLGVTYAERLPRTYHGWNQVEVDGGAVPIEDPRGHRVGRAPIDVDYFEALDAPLVSGRGFTLADLESGARVVIVDQPFVDRVLGGADPIGRGEGDDVAEQHGDVLVAPRRDRVGGL